MESRSKRHQSNSGPRKNPFILNTILFTVIFVGVIVIANWMAPNVMQWLSSSPVQTTTAPTQEVIAVTEAPKALVTDAQPSVAPSASISPTPTETLNALSSEDPATLTLSGELMEKDRVNIRLVGDILLGDRVADYMKENGFDYPYQNIKDELANADVTIGNMEAPVTTRGEAQDKQYVFRVSPEALPALKASGVDVVSLANNHTYDYGAEGLVDTVDYMKQYQVKAVGAGKDDAEAYRPLIVEKSGVKVAIFGFSRVMPTVVWASGPAKPGIAQLYNPQKALDAIKAVRAQVDLVIVYAHWGLERVEQPTATQQSLAKQMIDAGADLVAGSHPHVLQGFEQYRGKWIAYSLGNFIFTNSGAEKTDETAVLNASCDKSGSCQLKMIPVIIEAAQPKKMDATASQQLIDRIASISKQVRILADGTIESTTP